MVVSCIQQESLPTKSAVVVRRADSQVFHFASCFIAECHYASNLVDRTQMNRQNGFVVPCLSGLGSDAIVRNCLFHLAMDVNATQATLFLIAVVTNYLGVGPTIA